MNRLTRHRLFPGLVFAAVLAGGAEEEAPVETRDIVVTVEAAGVVEP